MSTKVKIGIALAAAGGVFAVYYFTRPSAGDVGAPASKNVPRGSTSLAARAPAKPKAKPTSVSVAPPAPTPDSDALLLETAGAIGEDAFNSPADQEAWADEDAAAIVARIN
jgi:hypothetical protein